MQIAREFILYGFFSGLAFLVDFAILAMLVEWGHWPYLAAAAVAFALGGLVAWRLSVRFVFRYRRISDQRVEAITFVLLGLVGLAANLGLLALGVECLHLHYLIAKLGAAACTVFLNFFVRRLVLFTRLTASRKRVGTGGDQ